MDSVGKKGKKGRGREGKGRGREFRRETAREGEGRSGKPGRFRRTPLFSKNEKLEQPGPFDKIVIIIYHPINFRESGHNLSKGRFLDRLCGQVLPFGYHGTIITNACPPKQSQKSLHPKLVAIFPKVYGVGNGA